MTLWIIPIALGCKDANSALTLLSSSPSSESRDPFTQMKWNKKSATLSEAFLTALNLLLYALVQVFFNSVRYLCERAFLSTNYTKATDWNWPQRPKKHKNIKKHCKSYILKPFHPVHVEAWDLHTDTADKLTVMPTAAGTTGCTGNKDTLQYNACTPHESGLLLTAWMLSVSKTWQMRIMHKWVNAV